MPAEWAPHEGTWLSWPKDPITWPEQLPEVEEIYTQMIEYLTPNEKVFLLVNDEEAQQKVLEKLKKRNVLHKNLIPRGLENLVIHKIPTVDAWIRDYGPNFLIRQNELAFNHWIFNAWGDKYEELKKDTDVPQRLKPFLNVPSFEPGIVLEGGSIDVNGSGTCLTTEQCLLTPTRNPHLKKSEIENTLKDFLGVSNVIWLGEGIVGDDTDGHVDDIVRFVNPNTVVCALEEDPLDENYELLKENYRRLELAKNEKGEKLNVIPFPMPGVVSYEGDRLPASYANFYIANGVVLTPIFGHSNDEKALKTLQKLFANRKVIGIRCENMVIGLGAIHCVTQQQPKIC
ncbi:MAG: agmatine deiminase family protein [Chlamydiae bacterium]|nr:agmatine deiminase family protein [Chlamydiota bacterium]MBI3266371.1 agmatine deiminase family protein [Chlamydiota bacterium]